MLAVVTFPEDLFYPVGVHTLGLFVKKGEPHKQEQKVLWMRALNDGRWKKKGKRLEHPKALNDYPQVLPVLKKFIQDQSIQVKSIPAFQKACAIDSSDRDLELVPEAYLDEKTVTYKQMNEGIGQLIREHLAFRIKYEKELESAKSE